jgi:hypothetical protein
MRRRWYFISSNFAVRGAVISFRMQYLLTIVALAQEVTFALLFAPERGSIEKSGNEFLWF